MLRNTFILPFWICSVLLFGQAQSNLFKPFSEEKLEALSKDTAKVDYLLSFAEVLHQKDPKAGLKYAAKALVFARRSGSKTHLMEALSTTGKCYFYAGYIGEAAAYIEEYAELAQLYGTDINKAFAYNDLAAIKSILPNEPYTPEARELFKKALALFKKIASSDPVLEADSAFQQNTAAIYGNIGSEYKKEGDLKMAESYLLKALELLEKTTVNTPLGVRIITSYAEVLQLQGKEREFFQQYARGMGIVNDMGYMAMSPILHYIMAQWYESRDNVASAIEYYQKVYEQCKVLENHSLIRSSATNLSKLYELTNNPEAALRFSRIAEESASKEKVAEIALNLKKAELKEQFRIWEQEILQQNKKRLQTILWFTGLTLGLAFLGFALLFIMRKKYRSAALQRLEIEFSSQKLTLEKKMLETELEASNKALTAEIMRKIQRNDLISTTVAQLQKYSRNAHSDVGNILKSAVRNLSDSLEEDAWKEFDIRFKQVDQRFYDKLAELCPDLTQGERRICAFLRLDMSSKEISAITGQSTRAIEIMRTRVRKKLGITNTEVSLSQFLSQL